MRKILILFLNITVFLSAFAIEIKYKVTEGEYNKIIQKDSCFYYSNENAIFTDDIFTGKGYSDEIIKSDGDNKGSYHLQTISSGEFKAGKKIGAHTITKIVSNVGYKGKYKSEEKFVYSKTPHLNLPSALLFKEEYSIYNLNNPNEKSYLRRRLVYRENKLFYVVTYTPEGKFEKSSYYSYFSGNYPTLTREIIALDNFTFHYKIYSNGNLVDEYINDLGFIKTYDKKECEYSEKGEVKAEHFYKNNTLLKTITYYAGGAVNTVANYNYTNSNTFLTFQYYDINGKILATSNYRKPSKKEEKKSSDKFLKDGVFETYHINGQILSKEIYKDNNLLEDKTYNIYGALLSETKYNENGYENKTYYFSDNPKELKIREHLIDNKKDGNYQYFNKNGEKLGDIKFDDNVFRKYSVLPKNKTLNQNDTYTEIYPNGQIAEITTKDFIEEYYESGQLYKKQLITFDYKKKNKEEYWLTTKLDDVETEVEVFAPDFTKTKITESQYYSNGQPKYSNNEPYKIYWENGHIKYEKRNGIVYRYYSNGNLAVKEKNTKNNHSKQEKNICATDVDILDVYTLAYSEDGHSIQQKTKANLNFLVYSAFMKDDVSNKYSNSSLSTILTFAVFSLISYFLKRKDNNLKEKAENKGAKKRKKKLNSKD